jgi:hypothetical protein
VRAYPPNIDEIDAAFHVRGKPVFFAYSDRIYNPAGVLIPPQIHVHEHVHCARQGGDPDGWWQKYIADVAFRLAEEIPAHQAEWRAYKMRHSQPEKRKWALDSIVARLASPLYGGMIDYHSARAAILSRASDESEPTRGAL